MRIDVKQCVACPSEAFVFYELSVSKLEFKRFTDGMLRLTIRRLGGGCGRTR